MNIQSKFCRCRLIKSEGKVIIEEDENGEYLVWKSDASDISFEDGAIDKAFVVTGYWFSDYKTGESFKLTGEQGACFKEVMRLFGGRIGQHIINILKEGAGNVSVAGEMDKTAGPINLSIK